LHNLFGKVNEVHVFLDETEPGGYYVEEVIKGNNIASVLSWIQYSPAHIEQEIKSLIDRKVREGLIKPREGVELQNFYENVLQGYTYIDNFKPNLQRSIGAGVDAEQPFGDLLQ
jgi:arginine decarboxylase